MQFKTSISLPAYDYKVSQRNPIFSIGSCFAQIMGQKLADTKFKITSNPFGTIYNPLSILQLLNFTIERNYPEEQSYLNNQDLFYNYYMHGEISDLSRERLEEKIINLINNVHQQLKESEWLLITLGSAYVYQREDNENVVANCHKVPARHFNRKILQVNDICDAFSATLQKIKSFNPGIRIIITVSPVRHVRDGLPENSVSKATLRLVCQQLVENFSFIDYFPSYEFLIDDLRDYRFYADDLVHPSKMAEEYIWHHFQQRYMSEATRQLIKEWSKVQQALQHRPYYPQSSQHQQFLHKTIEKLLQFKDKLDVSKELETLKKQII